MTRDRGDETPDLYDDPVLTAALHAIGDQHTPDPERIWARIDPARQRTPGVGDLAAPVVSLDARRSRRVRSVPRSRRPAVAVALAAASVLGVLVVGQSVFDPGPSAGDGPVTQAAARPSGADDAGRSAASTGSAVTRSPETTENEHGATSPDLSETPDRRTSATPEPSASASDASSPVGDRPGIAVRAAVDDDQLLVAGPASGVIDWMLPDGGDGQPVRARFVRGSGLSLEFPEDTVLTHGRWTTRWAGGTPVQDGSTTLWTVAQPGGVWTITLPRSPVARQLTVRVGNSPEVSVKVRSSSGWQLSRRGTGADLSRVVVELPADDGEVTVSLAGGDRAGLAIASVRVRVG